MPVAPRRAELEGYLEGVRLRLAADRRDESPDARGEAEWRHAREALRRGKYSEAEALLRAIDARRDARTPERVMTERPRGLISYTPKGGPEVATDPEEEALANRIRLLARLATVRASSGRDVTGIRRWLEEARRRYDAGDRAGARRAADEAHRGLEAEEPGAGNGRTR